MLGDIWTVFWRDWVVLRRRLTKYILSRMVSPLMFLVAFGWGLGRSIDVGAGSYLDFLVPGLLAMNSMNISFNSIISVHAERIYHRSLEEYLIAPIRPDAFVIDYHYTQLSVRGAFFHYAALSPRARDELHDLCGDRLSRGDVYLHL